ncbi:hypothetical protein [Sphingomonas sp. BK580]|uniref:hypothetical protein n=1 Tax=Sphingomonas sp. BK580 TaxID=2586972 RepID=UPI0016186716|nr:hypothetical protein [Sphingomonas sp. BK580]MBB3694802.1 hypothetical protein [Sphingomonas sp. BK580]
MLKWNRRVCALVAVALSSATVPVRAEPLTTEQVISLSSAGIGDEAIIAKIKSSGTRLDLSADQMVALKAKGVSGPVLAALLNGGNAASATPVLSIDALDPMLPHAPGVYVVDAAQTKMVRIDPTVTSQAKTGGLLGYAITGGIASMSMKASIANEAARVRTTGAPTFYFFFDESNPDSGRLVSTWLAGTATNATSPNEFTLTRLTAKKGRREARVGSFNIGGAKTGVMDKDRLAFSYDLVRPGVYKAALAAPLPKGEYGFVYSLAGGGSAGALTARIFDFSVL